MKTHFSILAWKIPWIEESGGLQSMGSQRVRCNWVNKYACNFEVGEPTLPPNTRVGQGSWTNTHGVSALVFPIQDPRTLPSGIHRDLHPYSIADVENYYQRQKPRVQSDFLCAPHSALAADYNRGVSCLWTSFYPPATWRDCICSVQSDFHWLYSLLLSLLLPWEQSKSKGGSSREGYQSASILWLRRASSFRLPSIPSLLFWYQHPFSFR